MCFYFYFVPAGLGGPLDLGLGAFQGSRQRFLLTLLGFAVLEGEAGAAHFEVEQRRDCAQVGVAFYRGRFIILKNNEIEGSGPNGTVHNWSVLQKQHAKKNVLLRRIGRSGKGTRPRFSMVYGLAVENGCGRNGEMEKWREGGRKGQRDGE